MIRFNSKDIINTLREEISVSNEGTTGFFNSEFSANRLATAFSFLAVEDIRKRLDIPEKPITLDGWKLEERGEQQERFLSELSRVIVSKRGTPRVQGLRIICVSTSGKSNDAKNSLVHIIDNALLPCLTPIQGSRVLLTSNPNRHAAIAKIDITKTEEAERYAESKTKYYIIVSDAWDGTLLERMCASILTDWNKEELKPLQDALIASSQDLYNAFVEDYYKEVIEKRKIELFENNFVKAFTNSSTREEEINNTLLNINRGQEKANQYFSNYLNELRIVTELNERLKMLTLVVKETENNEVLTEFLNFIRAYELDNIDVRYYDGSATLAFILKVPFLYWSEEIYKMCRASSQNRNSPFNTSETILSFLDAIFLEKKYTLFFRQRIAVKLKNICDTIGSNNTSLDEEGLENPHIRHYHCWGDNADLMQKHLRAKDYMSWYMQLKSAISGVDLGDSAVLSRFIGTLRFCCGDENDLGGSYRSAKSDTCVLVNGTRMTIKEAFQYHTVTLEKETTVTPEPELEEAPTPTARTRRRRTPAPQEVTVDEAVPIDPDMEF